MTHSILIIISIPTTKGSKIYRPICFPVESLQEEDPDDDGYNIKV